MARGSLGHRPLASLTRSLRQAEKPTAPPMSTSSRRPPTECRPHVHSLPLSSSHVGYHWSQVHLLLFAAFTHSAATIPTPLCVEDRWQVAALPAAVLVCHRCPKSDLILASSCAAAMCLRSTAVASAAGLTIECRLWPSSCPAATSLRTTPLHCYFPDPEPAAQTLYRAVAIVPLRLSRTPVESSIWWAHSSVNPSNWFTISLLPSSLLPHRSSPPGRQQRLGRHCQAPAPRAPLPPLFSPWAASPGWAGPSSWAK
jgi:hypothetical protein